MRRESRWSLRRCQLKRVPTNPSAALWLLGCVRGRLGVFHFGGAYGQVETPGKQHLKETGSRAGRGRVTRAPPSDHAPKLITLYVPFPPSCLPARRMLSLPTTAWRRRLRGFHCGTPLTKATIAQGVLYAIAASYVHRAKTQEATGRPRRRRRRLFCHRRGTPNAVAATKESIYEYVCYTKR